MLSQYQEGLKALVNIFEVYKTPIVHYQRSYDRVCQFIKKELTNRIIDADESHLKYALFDLISIKGSALFKNVHSKLDQAFGKLDLDENLRNETEKIRGKLRTQMDLQMHAFKEFVDIEDNQRAWKAKETQIAHHRHRLAQESAALMILIRIFYCKLEQEENAFPLSLASQKQLEGKCDPSLN